MVNTFDHLKQTEAVNARVTWATTTNVVRENCAFSMEREKIIGSVHRVSALRPPFVKMGTFPCVQERT